MTDTKQDTKADTKAKAKPRDTSDSDEIRAQRHDDLVAAVEQAGFDVEVVNAAEASADEPLVKLTPARSDDLLRAAHAALKD